MIEVRHFWRVRKRIAEMKRSGVADTDPKHEVRDVPRPTHRLVFSPHADAVGDLVADAREPHQGEEHAGDESHPPPDRRARLDDGRDVFRNPVQAAIIGHQRDALEFLGRFESDGGFRHYALVSLGSAAASCFSPPW
ncbi:MAG: hypothetical protein WDN28_21710 [Chthoniobacter sp.]